jgi:putative flippase GtrA
MYPFFNKILQIWFFIPQSLRYLLVGGYNTVVSLIIFSILYFILPNLHYLIISILAHFISVFNSAVTFRLLVFKVKDSFFIQLIRINISYLAYLLINLILMYILCNIYNVYPIYATIIAILILTPIFYFIHKFFSFKEKKIMV